MSDGNMLSPYICWGTLIAETNYNEFRNNQKLQWRMKLCLSQGNACNQQICNGLWHNGHWKNSQIWLRLKSVKQAICVWFISSEIVRFFMFKRTDTFGLSRTSHSSAIPNTSNCREIILFCEWGSVLWQDTILVLYVCGARKCSDLP